MNEHIIKTSIRNNIDYGKSIYPDIEIWVKQYQNKLIKVAYGILKDYHLAQDCVQETFIKAGLNYEKVRNKEKVYPWIYRILINECKGHLRSKWIRHVLRSERILDSGSSSYDTYPSIEKPNMYCYVEKLPYVMRMPILLYYFGDLSVSEISIALKIKESTCRVRLFRGRNMLKEIIEEAKQ